MNTLALLFIAAFLQGCASTQIQTSTGAHTPPPAVTTHSDWGNLREVKQVGRFYLAGLPDTQALAAFEAAGVKTVIDLRTEAEIKKSKAQGPQTLVAIKTYNVPIASSGPFDERGFRKIETILKANPSGPVLIHCSSGNRAGLWLGAHLATVENVAMDASVEAAKAAGLTRKETEASLRDFLSSRPN